MYPFLYDNTVSTGCQAMSICFYYNKTPFNMMADSGYLLLYYKTKFTRMSVCPFFIGIPFV